MIIRNAGQSPEPERSYPKRSSWFRAWVVLACMLVGAAAGIVAVRLLLLRYGPVIRCQSRGFFLFLDCLHSAR